MTFGLEGRPRCSSPGLISREEGGAGGKPDVPKAPPDLCHLATRSCGRGWGDVGLAARTQWGFCLAGEPEWAWLPRRSGRVGVKAQIHHIQKGKRAMSEMGSWHRPWEDVVPVDGPGQRRRATLYPDTHGKGGARRPMTVESGAERGARRPKSVQSR